MSVFKPQPETRSRGSWRELNRQSQPCGWAALQGWVGPREARLAPGEKATCLFAEGPTGDSHHSHRPGAGTWSPRGAGRGDRVSVPGQGSMERGYSVEAACGRCPALQALGAMPRTPVPSDLLFVAGRGPQGRAVPWPPPGPRPTWALSLPGGAVIWSLHLGRTPQHPSILPLHVLFCPTPGLCLSVGRGSPEPLGCQLALPPENIRAWPWSPSAPPFPDTAPLSPPPAPAVFPWALPPRGSRTLAPSVIREDPAGHSPPT